MLSWVLAHPDLQLQINSIAEGITLLFLNEVTAWSGLLRYGIPNMKLEKQIIDRKIAVMEEESITFVTGKDVGKIASQRTYQNMMPLSLLAGRLIQDIAREKKLKFILQ